MFKHLKSRQKTLAGISGFHTLVELQHNEKHIEIYGEYHNRKMTKSNIYTKIAKVLESDPEYPKPLILVEHSDDPRLCSLTEEDIPKFTEQIQYSGSELIFFKLINNPAMKENIKCVDNRISLGYLPAFKEMYYSKIIYQFLDIEPENIEALIDRIIAPLQEIIQVYKLQLDTLESNRDYYLETTIESLYELYFEVLRTQISICNILVTNNLLDTNISQILEIEETPNYYILLNILNAVIQNFIKISSLSVDINIFNIIDKDDNHNEILLFCGNNHCVRLTKLFFKYKGPLFDKSSEIIDNFSEEDIEKADIKPIYSEKDAILLDHLESSSNSSEKSANGKKKKSKKLKKIN